MRDRSDPIFSDPAAGGPGDDGEGSQEEERREILGQIDELVERERIQLRPETISFRARHRGLRMPLLVNGAALLLLLAGAILLPALFDRGEESIVSSLRGEAGAEGRLIEVVRQEAARRLQEKDLQLAEIRSRFSDLNQEIGRLQAELQSRIRGEEQSFRQTLMQTLVDRRRQMESQGLSQTAVEQRLRDVEAELRREQARRIEALEEQTAAALKEKEALRAAYLERYSQAVRQARLEQEPLEQALRAKLQGLETEAVRQYDTLQSENRRLSAELARAQAEWAGQQALLRQLLDGWEQVRAHLQNGRPAQALQRLETLRGYLSQESVAALPEFGSKMQGELFAIDSLADWIRGRREAAAQKAPGEPPQDPALQAARQTVEQADRQFRAGDTQAAQKLYRSALARIPELDRSYQRLLRMELAAAAAKTAAAQKPATRTPAEEAARGREVERAASAQAALAAAEARIRELEESQEELRGRLEESNRNLEAASALSRRLQQAVAARRSAAPASAEGPEPNREELLDLVQAKLKTREIVGSEPVRSQNPGLYEKLNRYFAEFERISRLEGRKAALREVNGTLDRLLQQKYAGQAPSFQAAGRGSLDPFSQFLDRLQALFE